MGMTGRRRIALAGSLAAVALGLGACTSGDATTKAGGPAILTLRIGTNESLASPTGQIVAHLVDDVRSRSHGAIVLAPTYEFADDDDPDAEADVARGLGSGRFDLAVVASRAWDRLGVASLAPLQDPMLVESDAAASAVAHDPVADDLMTDLGDVGVVGLALVPEGLRRLFSFAGPIEDPTALAGHGVIARPSRTTDAVLAALGAHAVVPGSFDDAGASVVSGEVVAAESGLAWYDRLPTTTSLLVDLVLFPKVDVVGLAAATGHRLTDAQRSVLSDAARDTVGWVAHHLASDESLLDAYCRAGGLVSWAHDAGRERFRTALAAVEETWRADVHQAKVLHRLRTVVAASHHDVVVPASCRPDGPGPGGAPSAPPTPTAPALRAFPAGTWREVVSEQALLDAGVPAQRAQDDSGPWTVTFRDGRLDFHDGCHGTYAVSGDRVELRIADDCPTMTDRGRVLFSAAWRQAGDTLRFLDVRADPEAPQAGWYYDVLFGGRDWVRVD